MEVVVCRLTRFVGGASPSIRKRMHSYVLSVTVAGIFVGRPTLRASMAQGLFQVGRGAGPQPTRARSSQKCLRPLRHSPYQGRLRRRAINQTSPKGVKAWGEGPLRPQENPQAPRHTPPEPLCPKGCQQQELKKETNTGTMYTHKKSKSTRNKNSDQAHHPCHRLFDQDGHQDSSSASLQSRPCSL